MKRALSEIARDLKAYISAQDENLLDVPAGFRAAGGFAGGTGEVPTSLSAGSPPQIEPEEIRTASDVPDPGAAAASDETDRAVLVRERFIVLEQEVQKCRACGLGASRLRPVFGTGTPHARVVFVGEGPGFQEDHLGKPFVGKSGQLLDKILETVFGMKRSEVYIANIVKCHPMKDPSDPELHSNDRPPTPEEIACCRHFLDEQLRLIQPLCIVTLGSVPTKVLLNTTKGISLMRGRNYPYPFDLGRPVTVIPTYHPAALLRNPNLKRDTWEDMKRLRALLQENP